MNFGIKLSVCVIETNKFRKTVLKPDWLIRVTVYSV